MYRLRYRSNMDQKCCGFVRNGPQWVNNVQNRIFWQPFKKNFFFFCHASNIYRKHKRVNLFTLPKTSWKNVNRINSERILCNCIIVLILCRSFSYPFFKKTYLPLCCSHHGNKWCCERLLPWFFLIIVKKENSNLAQKKIYTCLASMQLDFLTRYGKYFSFFLVTQWCHMLLYDFKHYHLVKHFLQHKLSPTRAAFSSQFNSELCLKCIWRIRKF